MIPSTTHSAAILEDVFIPQPFQVVFYEGQNTSTSCIAILILRDVEFEMEESFSISIIREGSVPNATIVSPFVATVTIQEDTTPEPSSEESAALSLPWLIATLSVSIIVVGVSSCLGGLLVYRCRVHCKMTKDDDPLYDYVVTDDKMVTSPNKAYTELNRSLPPQPAVANHLAITTSPNESYQQRLEMNPAPIATSMNEAYLTSVSLLVASSHTSEPSNHDAVAHQDNS